MPIFAIIRETGVALTYFRAPLTSLKPVKAKHAYTWYYALCGADMATPMASPWIENATDKDRLLPIHPEGNNPR